MAITKLNRYSLPTTLDLSAKTLTLPSASVTAHVTQTDLQPIKSDISALALREATNESSAAFNLPNQFIETFTDDTNLGTQTTCDRDTGGFMKSFALSGSHTSLGGTGGTTNMPNTGFLATDHTGTNTTLSSTTAANYLMDGNTGTHGGDTPWFRFANSTDWITSIKWTLGSQISVNKIRWFSVGYNGRIDKYRFEYSTDNVSWTVISGGTATDNGTVDASTTYDASNANEWQGATWTPVTAKYWKIAFKDYQSEDDCAVSQVEIFGDAGTFSATGTLIQSANAVGSAKTKVGGTMLYKDNAGTATLGTDLKIYFTCNGGSNWTEASSYSAITPVYSTGIKQVRLGETTCTSGTDVRYKAVWANQAASSKETQLHGIGVNY